MQDMPNCKSLKMSIFCAKGKSYPKCLGWKIYELQATPLTFWWPLQLLQSSSGGPKGNIQLFNITIYYEKYHS